MNTMQRRTLLGLVAGLGASGQAAGKSPTSPGAGLTFTGPKSTAGLPMPDPLVHLLGRIGYGINQQEHSAAESIGFQGWVDYQLDHEAIDDSQVEDLIAAAFPTVGMSAQDIINLGQTNDYNFALELIAATLIRRLISPRQLFERMVEFWGDHFSVNIFDGPVSYLKTLEDREVMRAHALGSFSDILHADARSAAMLYYLDNFSNTVAGPNENYARELLELHTLGVDGGYTEDDVKEVARAFTGWSISSNTSDLFAFFSFNHDFDSKTVLGQTIPAGGGITDGETVLDLLAGHPSTAQFIATKLVRRFVQDDPDPALVDVVAQRFDDTSGDLRETMRTLLLSPEFAAATDAKFKRPTVLVLSLVRTLDPFTTERFGRVLFEPIFALGHGPFTWPTPDGFPDEAAHWQSTSALLGRWNLGLGVADGSLKDSVQLKIFNLMGDARSAEALVDRLVDQVLHRPIAVEDRQSLIDYAAGGGSPTANLPLDVAVVRARELVGLIAASRYFQQV